MPSLNKKFLLTILVLVTIGSNAAASALDCDSPPSFVGWWEWTGTYMYDGTTFLPDVGLQPTYQKEFTANGMQANYRDEEFQSSFSYWIECDGPTSWLFFNFAADLIHVTVSGEPGSRTLQFDDTDNWGGSRRYVEREGIETVSNSVSSFGSIKALFR